MVRIFLAWCLFFGALSSFLGSARAEDRDPARDAEARALFDAGRVAYDDGRYGDALGHFQRSYELSSRPGLLFNIGSAAERVRNDRLALDAYRRYLAEIPDAPNRSFVEKRIRFLEEALAEGGEGEPTAPSEGSPAAATSPGLTFDTASTPPPERRDSNRGVLGRWWFWATLSAVVIAGATTGIFLATRRSNSGGIEPPIPGDLGPGGIVVTLGGGR